MFPKTSLTARRPDVHASRLGHTLHCLTEGCDFEYVDLPTLAAIHSCPKCGGMIFGTESVTTTFPPLSHGGFMDGLSFAIGARPVPIPRPWQEQDFEELELSPAQSQVWGEYDEAIRERRDRLARRQSWLFRHRYGILFWAFLAGLMAIEAFSLWAINRFYLVAF